MTRRIFRFVPPDFSRSFAAHRRIGVKTRGFEAPARLSNDTVQRALASKLVVSPVVGGSEPTPDPLTVSINSPAADSYLPIGSPITISGTVSRSGASVSLTGLGAATVVGTNWTRTLTPTQAQDGVLSLQAAASEGGDNANASRNVNVVGLNPVLGLSLASAASADIYQNATATHQGKLALWFDPVANKWLEAFTEWDITQALHINRRYIDTNTWTVSSVVGAGFRPHFVDPGPFDPLTDNDEHYNSVLHLFKSGWKFVHAGTHVDAPNWQLLAPGVWDLGPARRDLMEPGSTNEYSVGTAGITYMQVEPLPNGDCFIHYRFGSSGDGKHVLKRWIDVGNPGNEAGSQPICVTVGATFLVDFSVAGFSSYVGAIKRCPNTGKLAIAMNGRGTTTATTAEDVIVAFSNDEGLTWFKNPECTIPQTVPITRANCRTIKDTANGEGMWDLPTIAWDDTGTRPAVLCQYCTGPGSPHGTGNTPHDTEYHVLTYQGSDTWSDVNLGGLEEDTGSHYANTSSGRTRQIGDLVYHSGKWIVFTGTCIPEFIGLYAHVFATSAPTLVEHIQIDAGPSGGGWGYCSPIFNHAARRLRPDLVGLMLVKNKTFGLSPYGTAYATTNSYVHYTDLSTIGTPVNDGALWRSLPAGTATICAFTAHASRVVQSSGSLSRMVDSTGHSRHANAPTAGNNPLWFASGGPALASGTAPYIRGDGTAKYLLVNTVDPNLPTAQALVQFAVINIGTDTNSRNILSAGQQRLELAIVGGGGARTVAVRNGTTFSSVLALGAGWALQYAVYRGSTTDVFACGANAPLTGLTLGNNNPTQLSLLAQYNTGTTTPSLFADAMVAEFGLCNAPADATALIAALKTAAATKYPGLAIPT